MSGPDMELRPKDPSFEAPDPRQERRVASRGAWMRPAARPIGQLEVGIVIPAYNEEAVIEQTAQLINRTVDRLILAGKAAEHSRIWFVDDGSTDQTWRILEGLARQNARIRAIKLTRNRGHQNALLAGLLTASGDVIVSMDADMQDDVAAIERMIDEYSRGNDVVYGVRQRRDTDTFFKRNTALAFYRLLRLMGVETVENHADYRLMSRRAIEALGEFGEVNLFLRGIVPLIGFRSSRVYYDRKERFAGESKYPLRKMLKLAWDAVTSFSVVPLRAITVLGALVFMSSMALSLWVLWVRLATDNALPGWASVVLPMAVNGGVQILSLGVIGEYLAKVYAETKHRPRYLIEKVL
jgi:glycosyltransferase involved in cell wall biosynthesis